MKKAIRSAALVAICFVPAILSLADDVKLRKALTANYAVITSAFRKQDVKAMGDLMTSDFTAIRPGGQTISREQILADFEHQTKATKVRNWIRNIETISQQGDNAIVTVRGKMTGTITDEKGKPHKMEFDAKAKDTWTKSGKGWKLKRTELLEGKMLVDGKEVPSR